MTTILKLIEEQLWQWAREEYPSGFHISLRLVTTQKIEGIEYGFFTINGEVKTFRYQFFNNRIQISEREAWSRPKNYLKTNNKAE